MFCPCGAEGLPQPLTPADLHVPDVHFGHDKVNKKSLLIRGLSFSTSPAGALLKRGGKVAPEPDGSIARGAAVCESREHVNSPPIGPGKSVQFSSDKSSIEGSAKSMKAHDLLRLYQVLF